VRAGIPGITLLEGDDAGPVPMAFAAVTLNVYAVSFVNLVIVIGLDEPVAVTPPGLEITVYPIIALPPSEAGAVKLTVACAFPIVAVTPVGVPGAVGCGVTLLEASDAEPVPMAFAAVTLNVYAVPFVRPVMV